jgi:hypothetical protein
MKEVTGLHPLREDFTNIFSSFKDLTNDLIILVLDKILKVLKLITHA